MQLQNFEVLLLNNWIYYHNQEEISFINIVRGDIDGDGDVTLPDYGKIQMYLKKASILKNEYLLAADINDDTMVNSGDLLRLRQHLLGVKKLS